MKKKIFGVAAIVVALIAILRAISEAGLVFIKDEVSGEENKKKE